MTAWGQARRILICKPDCDMSNAYSEGANCSPTEHLALFDLRSRAAGARARLRWCERARLWVPGLGGRLGPERVVPARLDAFRDVEFLEEVLVVSMEEGGFTDVIFETQQLATSRISVQDKS